MPPIMARPRFSGTSTKVFVSIAKSGSATDTTVKIKVEVRCAPAAEAQVSGDEQPGR